MTTDEQCEPTRIGAGSFATVFVIRGGPEAFKEVARATAEDTATLRQEFDFLEDIYRKCNGDSFFAIPRGLAFNDPFAVSDGFLAHDAPSPASVARRRGVRPVVTAGVMAAFSRPAYAMDRVYALPYDAGKVIARLFFPPTIKDSPALCRLYFGKDFSNAKASRFINTQNFPLDASRYMQLRAAFPEELPDASVIAKGMGEMLARLHYRSAVDARDVEFVLGGAGKARFSYFIIDFNQVRACPKGAEGTTQALVNAFFDNDPYYPRPRPADSLYTHFKQGYVDACSSEDRPLADAFLNGIESEQIQRDLNRG